MPSSGFAYVVPLFLPFQMAFWSRFIEKCRLAGPQGVGFSDNTVLESDSLWEQESPTTMELQANGENSKDKRQTHWHCERQLRSKEEFCKDFFKTEVCELANPSYSSAVGFREDFLPVSVFSRVVIRRFSVFLLHFSAVVMLFPHL